MGAYAAVAEGSYWRDSETLIGVPLGRRFVIAAVRVPQLGSLSCLYVWVTRRELNQRAIRRGVTLR